MKNITSLIYFSIAISGCQVLSKTSIYDVDFEHLVRSAFYTQRELLELQLTSSNERDMQRYAVLTSSYCDLIDRGYINVTRKPDLCLSYSDKSKLISNKLINKRHCMADFHRCFKSCSLRNKACKVCEEKAKTCLI